MQVANFASPYAGNLIPSLRVLGERLASEGYRQVLALPARARQRAWLAALERDGVPVRLLPDGGSELRQAWAIAAIARRENAVALHAHFAGCQVAAWVAARLLRLRSFGRQRCEVIWHIHSSGATDRRLARLRGWPKYFLMSGSVRAVAVSPGCLESVVQRGMARERIRVILNGIDIARATRHEHAREDVRRELGIGAEATVLLLFGYAPHIKGVDVAVRAMQSLAPKRGDLRLVVVGREATAACLREILGGRLPDAVQLVPPRECVADYYAAADAYLIPSRSEGMPYGVLESLANGLPVIGSDIPGLAWAKGAPNLFLFPTEDADALARTIVAVTGRATDEARAQREAAQRFVRDRYSLDRWATEMMQYYRETVLVRA